MRIPTALASAFAFAAALAAQAAPLAYISESGGSTVAVFDPSANRVVATIPVGRGPRGVAVNLQGTRAYVGNSGDSTVSVIDTAANRVIATIGGIAAPESIAVNRGGTRVYVTNVAAFPSTAAVTVIDAGTHTVVANIPVGVTPTGLALSPDGKRLYVANANSRSISVIDTASLRVVTTIPTQFGPHSVAVDPSGTRVYATLPRYDERTEGTVIVIDVEKGMVAGSVTAGFGPFGISLNPTGTRAYVSNLGNENFPGNTVSVIDTATFTVVATVRVGQSPNGVSVDALGQRAYVANTDSVTLSVIDTAGNSVIATVGLGPSPTSISQFPFPDNYQGLWWNPAESGWGVHLVQQGNILFATWFTYDADGTGMWLVMSNGVNTGPSTYSGALHRTTGPSFDSVPWKPAEVTSTPVGTATFAFTGPDRGTFTYTVNGITQSKVITPLQFSSPMPNCTAGGTAGATTNYQDLWWRSPAGSESGWGVNIAHQGDVLFATWFTYGATGKGRWLSMSAGVPTGTNQYSGELYQTSGPPFSNQPWDPAKVTRLAVGTATFTFTDSDNGTFDFDLQGVTRSVPITRLAYSLPATLCR
jgi:YVTN family beta-propeller protein